MFNLIGLKVDKIKLKLGSVIGRVLNVDYKKEEHNEQTLNFLKIEKQIIVSLPPGTSPADGKELIKALIDDKPVVEEIPSEATGNLTLPASTTNKPVEQFLQQRLNEYKGDSSLLLDKGGLFAIYKARNDISFSKDELIFLTQSSLKNDFPFWFWAFYYREKFNHVVPLFQSVYVHPEIKIRKAAITAFSKFTETEDDIALLAESEREPYVLGHIVHTLTKKEDNERAQRVLANALSRRILPIFEEKVRKDFEKTYLELGTAEKRFLYSIVDTGWTEEIINALFVLQISANETDLPALEKIYDEVSFPKFTVPILQCIKKIGKTNKAAEIEKSMHDTKWQEYFLAQLETLASAGYKEVFPQLLKWMSNPRSVTIGWWEKDERGLESALAKAVVRLLDKDTYELLVKYILDTYDTDEYGNIMSWRYFWALKDALNNLGIAELVNSETRLDGYEHWAIVIEEISIQTKIKEKTEEGLFASLELKNIKQTYLILREYYKIASPSLALQKIAPLVGSIKSSLKERLASIQSGEHEQSLKDIAKNDLEEFLGENEFFFRRNARKTIRRLMSEKKEKDEIFDKLMEDVDGFSTLEKEYLSHIFKEKSEEINKILLESIGGPYECIYENLEINTTDTDTLRNALVDVVKNHENPLIKIQAIITAHKLSLIDDTDLRSKTLEIINFSREKLTATIKGTKDNNEWFPHELTYGRGMRALIEFGNPSDFHLVREEVNREKILYRHYYQYSYFFDYEVFSELMSLIENLEDARETKEASEALDSLDYKWTKKVLAIKE